jgi:hypothetical protein
LEELLLKSDLDECCYLDYEQDYGKVKQCRTISEPPGFYQSIMNEEKQNYCPNEEKQSTNSLKPIKTQLNSTLGLEDTYNKIKLSFQLMFNSFKLSFQLKN